MLEPLVPPLPLAICIACVAGAGLLANCSLVAALCRARRNGLFSIIIQLNLADLFLGISLSPEVWSHNSRTWDFGNNGCMVYRGLRVFASTASSYIVATIALHSIALFNLEEKKFSRRIKRNEQDDELRSSRHSLVTSSDSSTPPRTMNLDYRFNDTSIPVAQPTTFVWILSMSLSVPEFVLASTVRSDNGAWLCSVTDSDNRMQIYSILALSNIILPVIIMFASGVLVTIKLNSKKIIACVENLESIASLRLSLLLIAVYIFLCVPHSLLTGYNYYSTLININDSVWLVVAQNSDTLTLLNLVLSGTYMLSTLVRPITCIVLLPSVRKMLSFRSVDMNSRV